MSGIVGSVREASKEFNDLDTNNTIKGIRTANNLERKIKDTELKLKKQATQVQEKPAEEIDPAKLVEDIKDDMYR